jgi:hypothetical protein
MSGVACSSALISPPCASTRERAGTGVAVAAFERAPPAHARSTDAKARSGFPVAGPVGYGLQDPDAEIEGERFRHVRRPPYPADILNQT